MDKEVRIDLAKYRLEKAQSCLRQAKILYENKEYEGAANRSYYAIFHTVNALLVLDDDHFKKHSAVISAFQKNYIKTGIFEPEYSKIISNAFNIRQKSDYDDFYVIPIELIKDQMIMSDKFFHRISGYIHNKIEDMSPSDCNCKQ